MLPHLATADMLTGSPPLQQVSLLRCCAQATTTETGFALNPSLHHQMEVEKMVPALFASEEVLNSVAYNL